MFYDIDVQCVAARLILLLHKTVACVESSFVHIINWYTVARPFFANIMGPFYWPLLYMYTQTQFSRSLSDHCIIYK